jgi:hypothetical protein
VLLPGTAIAQFTSAPGFYGLASFQFTVTDTQGAALTNTIGVHIRALPQSQLAIILNHGVPYLEFTGEPGFYYLLQFSEDLTHWTTWTNVTAASSPMSLSPLDWPAFSARFYRAISVQ